MTIPLRVLILEDHPDDAELMLYELGKAGYASDWRQVEKEPDYLAALDWPPELILADYSMPQFNAMRALQLLRERNLNIPFIVVTNSISEEVAVKCVKQGAADYLLKDRLTRLGPAVAHALEQEKDREQRKQAEIALQYSSMLTKTILDSVSNHIAVLDRQGAIILVNEAWERHAKENGDPHLIHTGVGVNYLDVCRRVKGEDREIALAAHAGIEAVLNGKLPHFGSLEYSCHSLNHERWFILQVTPMPSRLGGVVVSHIDVTDQKQIEERMRQQDRLSVVGQLAAGIAHDFNNILSVITLYSQLLLKAQNVTGVESERLQIINKQAHRATRLITQIMDFSRQSVMERHPLELRTFLNSLVALLKRTLPENIQIKLICSQRDLLVSADLTHLEQVFMNLAVNARDAMPNGGIIQIEVNTLSVAPHQPPPVQDMPPGQWARITVADTGVGISSKNLRHIFEPFFTTKAHDKGTGLGLAQVYGIMKQHDGFIDVVSQLGEGATFTLYLPLLSLPELTEATLPTEPILTGHGETILVVEDDHATREATSDTLQLLNYEVITAKNGKEALSLFERQQANIALVLSDIIMPVMDGMELFQKLAKQAPNVKMIAMTGYAANVNCEDLLQLGMVDCLHKPFDVEQIAQALHRALTENAALN